MKNLFHPLLFAFALLSLNISAAQAQLYEVTVTNLTRGQIFSTLFAFTHNSKFTLFTAGQPASPELAALAQDANTDGLNDLLSVSDDVHEIVPGSGNILPGDSDTFLINSRGNKRFFSLATMLVTTNDAFTAVNKLKLSFRHHTLTVPAYDAGAENNDESCDYIPGPPCGIENAASDVVGEGFIHTHSGIHGVGNLDPAQHDWRNPVARVSIKRVRKVDD